MFSSVNFNERPVAPPARALRLYREQLGLRGGVDRPYQEGTRWMEVEVPGAQPRILFAPRPDERPVDTPSLALLTADVQASYEALRAKGVVFTQAPTVAPGNPQALFALLRDNT